MELTRAEHVALCSLLTAVHFSSRTLPSNQVAVLALEVQHATEMALLTNAEDDPPIIESGGGTIGPSSGSGAAARLETGVGKHIATPSSTTSPSMRPRSALRRVVHLEPYQVQRLQAGDQGHSAVLFFGG